MTEEAEATDAAPSRGLWLGALAFVLAFGAAGYAWRGNFQALAMSPGDAAVSAASDRVRMRCQVVSFFNNGSILSRSTSGVTGPMCFRRIVPWRSMTKVSGTP